MVVLLRPALLQADDIWLLTCGGDLNTDFCEALVAQLGDELEAPAVEGKKSNLGRWLDSLRSHGGRVPGELGGQAMMQPGEIVPGMLQGCW